MADNLQHCEIEIPSKVFNREFIWAETQEFQRQEDTTYAGKWMLFASLARGPDGLTHLDRLWKQIALETFMKKFYKASASTSKETHLSRDDYGVICVHTTDYRDESEVLMVGIKLVLLLNMLNTPLLKAFEYKTYEETENGPYPGPNLYKIEYSKEFLQFYNSAAEEGFEENLNLALLSLLPNASGPCQKSPNYLGRLNDSQSKMNAHSPEI